MAIGENTVVSARQIARLATHSTGKGGIHAWTAASMDFLHYEIDCGPDVQLNVALDCAANVRVMDRVNFQLFRSGRPHWYLGGLVKQSPAILRGRQNGHWNVVIDLGTKGGTVKAGLTLTPDKPALPPSNPKSQISPKLQ